MHGRGGMEPGQGFFGCKQWLQGCSFRYVPHECIINPMLSLEASGPNTFKVGVSLRLGRGRSAWQG